MVHEGSTRHGNIVAMTDEETADAERLNRDNITSAVQAVASCRRRPLGTLVGRGGGKTVDNQSNVLESGKNRRS